MTPRYLRAREGIGAAEMARRLSMSVPTLRLLEATPTTAWKVETLTTHLPAIASICWREAGPGGGLAVCCPSPTGGESCIPEWRYEQLLNTRPPR
jgi:hypothetical protein